MMKTIMSIKVDDDHKQIQIDTDKDTNVFFLYGILSMHIEHMKSQIQSQLTQGSQQDYMG